MLYIAATVEDLSSWEGLKCFSKSALAAIIDWHDEQEIDQEADAAELRGEWTEYDDAGAMWYALHDVDEGLPIIYDPDQLESLTDALEAVGYNIIRTETGAGSSTRPSPHRPERPPRGPFPLPGACPGCTPRPSA